MMRPFSSLVLLSLLTLVLPACRKPVIQSRIVPKEIPDTAEASDPSAAAPRAAASETSLGYVKPDSWKKEQADRLNVAKFSVGEGDQTVGIAVTPLVEMSGREAILVNMWRQAVSLPALSDADAANSLHEVTIAQTKGGFFEITGKINEADSTIITAYVHHGDKTWFFKLNGPPAAVAAQKEAFFQFLKTVQFRDDSGI